MRDEADGQFGTDTGRCPTAGGRCYGFGLSFMVKPLPTSSGALAVTWRPPGGRSGAAQGAKAPVNRAGARSIGVCVLMALLMYQQ